MSAIGINMQRKRNLMGCQSLDVKEAVHHGDSFILRGVPQEGRGRMVRHLQVAGKAGCFLRRQGAVAQQIFKAAQMGDPGFRRNDGVAKNGCLNSLALREDLPHLGPIEAGGIVGGQVE